MALLIPFTRDTFSEEMKPKFSGGNLTLEFDNLESTLIKVGVEISKLIGQTLYDAICNGSAGGTDAEGIAKCADAKDFLQRAMLHFTLYQHSIFLIAKIGNDGITTKKTDNETTIYKYQQVQLENKLINDAWFWMNNLIKYLNTNADTFTEWKDSDSQKEYAAIPIGVDDFSRFVGVSDEYFVMSVMWIIREAWTDCVLSRLKTPTKTDKIARAMCYEVLSRACIRLSYYALPEQIRLGINTELGKDHATESDTYIREKVANQFQIRADGYWSSVDSEIATIQSATPVANASAETYNSKEISKHDKYGFTS